jgi:arylsulfatase A-like enzyme
VLAHPAALMTGRNHHSVAMGVTSEMSTSEPGYSGYRPASAATIAQILHGNGYITAAFGKWHQTPPVEVTASGPFTRWPTGEGFDRFYGFMGAEMNHWYPQLYDGTTPVEPERLPEDGYHLTEDLVDHAVDWVRLQQTLSPDKPFFAYLATGATHAPFHVPREWIERNAGRFDDGWDDARARILERQVELGVVRPGPSSRPGPTVSRTGRTSTSRGVGSRHGSWRPMRGSPSTPTTTSADSCTHSTTSGSSTTRCSSTCSAATAPPARAAPRAPCASTWSATAWPTTCP